MTTRIQKLLIYFIPAIMPIFIISCDDVFGVRGTGDIVTEIRDVDNFHALDISTCGDVELRVGPTFKVEVSCEESIIPFLETLEDNGVLKVHFDRDVRDVDGLRVVATAPNWDGIEISGSADVDAPDQIGGNILDISIFGSGDVKVFKADFNKIKTRISGSGNITVSGIADDLSCTTSGSGDTDASGCPVLTAKVNISGSGNTRVNVQNQLDVTISGSGDVDYLGNPTVNSQISGSGRVHKL